MNTLWIRVDSSREIGEGHLRRCLTIASNITRNISVYFCCAQLTEFSRQLINDCGFPIIDLTGDEQSQLQCLVKHINRHSKIKNLLIDHYNISAPWEKEVKKLCLTNVIVIDDLADRKHDCDMLIDANYFRTKSDYYSLTNSTCEVLCGIEYLTLSNTVMNTGKLIESGNINKKPNTTHVFFGTTDPHSNSAQVSILLSQKLKQQVSLSLTKSTNNLELQRNLVVNNNGISISTNNDSFPRKMASCEYAVGAPGITLWERLFLGCKTGCFATHKNQVAILKQLDEIKLCCYLGPIWQMTELEIEQVLKEFYLTRSKLIKKTNKQVSSYSQPNTVNKIMKFYPELKVLTSNSVKLVPYLDRHIPKTVEWLSSSQLRKTFGFSKNITIDSHKEWLSQQKHLFIWAIEFESNYVGNITVRTTEEAQNGYLEIYLGESSYKGQKVGLNAMQLVIQWAFNIKKIERIDLITIEGNKAAEGLYKKLGFIFAGTEYNCQKIGESYVNHNKWYLSNKA